MELLLRKGSWDIETGHVPQLMLTLRRLLLCLLGAERGQTRAALPQPLHPPPRLPLLSACPPPPLHPRTYAVEIEGGGDKIPPCEATGINIARESTRARLRSWAMSPGL